MALPCALIVTSRAFRVQCWSRTPNLTVHLVKQNMYHKWKKQSQAYHPQAEVLGYAACARVLQQLDDRKGYLGRGRVHGVQPHHQHHVRGCAPAPQQQHAHSWSAAGPKPCHAPPKAWSVTHKIPTGRWRCLDRLPRVRALPQQRPTHWHGAWKAADVRPGPLCRPCTPPPPPPHTRLLHPARARERVHAASGRTRHACVTCVAADPHPAHAGIRTYTPPSATIRIHAHSFTLVTFHTRPKSCIASDSTGKWTHCMVARLLCIHVWTLFTESPRLRIRPNQL